MGFRHWRLDRAGETLAGVADADNWDFRAFARDGGGADEDRELWELETGEEIAKPRKGNRIQRAFEEQQAYNSKERIGQQANAPRPLAWTAMGNPFLLDAPLLVSVRISTATPTNKLDELVSKYV